MEQNLEEKVKQEVTQEIKQEAEKAVQQDTTYYISEAAKKVKVESHVLRYWEEELELPIHRNEMGHRYYTQEDIRKLQEIKQLKDQGLQLKAIKPIISKGEGVVLNKAQKYVVSLAKENHVAEPEPAVDKNEKAARLQYLLQHMITEAVRTANQEMCTDVKESILKELDYQFRMQEERDEEHYKKEEEHYRKIDEMIRERHNAREKLKKGKRKSPINL